MFFGRLLDQFPSHQSDNSDTVTDAIEAYCGMTEMEKEIQTLQRKVFFRRSCIETYAREMSADGEQLQVSASAL